MVTPRLGELPVYVREGSILPIAPLVQSTVEKPVGPLTLRVLPGDNCEGSVYQDDGETYDFRKGTYFRQHFACTVSTDGTVTVSLAKAECTLHPWWTSVRIEVVGFPAGTGKAISGNQTLTVSATPFGSAATVDSSRTPETVTFSVQH